MHAVIETTPYVAHAKAAGVEQDELDEIAATIAANPRAGAIIRGSGGARKLRFAAKDNKGKSGGVRVITYFAGDNVPVFLLALFAKGEKDNLTAAEVNALKKLLAKIGPEYLAGVQRKVAELKGKQKP
jgi:hypothetical protein